VLTNETSGQYWLFHIFGRMGTAGQVLTKDYNTEVRGVGGVDRQYVGFVFISLLAHLFSSTDAQEEATAAFEKKFEEKCGNEWACRGDFKLKKGKYSYRTKVRLCFCLIPV
jgi:hypothetical protein